MTYFNRTGCAWHARFVKDGKEVIAAWMKDYNGNIVRLHYRETALDVYGKVKIKLRT